MKRKTQSRLDQRKAREAHLTVIRNAHVSIRASNKRIRQLDREIDAEQARIDRPRDERSASPEEK